MEEAPEDQIKPEKKRVPRVEKWKARVIAGVAACESITSIAKELDMALATIYERRHLDAEFAAQWKQAEEYALDHLETVAHDRANGKSDKMLQFILRNRRKEKYGDILNLPANTPIVEPEIEPDEDHS